MLKAFGERLSGGKVDVLGDLVKAGFLGRKSGKGFFLYDDHSSKGSGSKPVNLEALEIIKQRYSMAPIGANSPEDQIMRMVSRFINEAVLCLEEGILSNSLEGDVGAVFGLGKLFLSFNRLQSINSVLLSGFPPFSGGPFRFVDQYTASKLVGQMNRYQELFGAPFKPAQTLLDMAKDPSKKFYKKN